MSKTIRHVLITASLSLDQVLETVADSCLHELRGDLVSTWL